MEYPSVGECIDHHAKWAKDCAKELYPNMMPMETHYLLDSVGAPGTNINLVLWALDSMILKSRLHGHPMTKQHALRWMGSLADSPGVMDDLDYLFEFERR